MSPANPSGGADALTGAVVDAVDAAALEAGFAPAVVRPFAEALLRREEAPTGPAGVPAVATAVVDAFRFAADRTPDRVVAVRAVPDGVLEVTCDDRPYLVSSVVEELQRQHLGVARVASASYGAVRDADGALVATGPARGAERAEAYMQFELDQPLDDRAAALARDVEQVLTDVVRTTDDQDAMHDVVRAAAVATKATAGTRFPDAEVAEVVDLVDWALDGNLVLLGLGTFPVRAGRVGEIDDSTCLGVLRDPGTSLRQPPEEPSGELLEVRATAEVSTVHRQVPIERFDLAVVDDEGAIVAIGRLAAVFSRAADGTAVRDIPVVRRKVDRILQLEDAVAGSYDEQSLVSLVQALPKDELFCRSIDEIHRAVRGLLREDRADRVRALVRPAPGGHAVSLLLSLPGELYSASLRLRLERFLRTRVGGDRVDVDVSVRSGTDTVVRMLAHLPPGHPMPVGLDEVAREVRELCRTWEQRLAEALASTVGEAAATMAATWAARLPTSYRDLVAPADAVVDVIDLDAMTHADEALRARLSTGEEAGTGTVSVVSPAGAAVELSRLVPILESLGLWVIDEVHWALGSGGHLQRLTVRDATGPPIDAGADGQRISEAVIALWRGAADVDPLNRLVLRAGMGWTDVAVLRAYRRYRRQVDTRYNERFIDDVLVEHPEVARGLVALFHARAAGTAGSEEACAGDLAEACGRIVRLDHDRVLRGLAGTVAATVATNHPSPDGQPLALKLDPSRVPDVPNPVPYREVFVFGRQVEGVHLRFGPVARGGLRLSDRHEDFRAEVLDLARTQVLKNALIVPTGAKGGFVLRPGARGAVEQAYEAFVGALLDVTDEADPYLVVAADRGTAQLSDLANRVSRERGFWLGDAFASGGSTGYDHKALGITARGAWVQVARHLGALGIDVDRDPFTVVGVGDMSGDVFGNGMMQSEAIRLVAAFDHRHIFVDPDPDPARSHAERRRLFEQARSSWDDYDRSALSEGGGVFSRSQARIELNRHIRQALRLDVEALTPPELIRAILRAPVDLLYLGGIGTYVRASTEDDGRLDDRANSEVRVTAKELRARAVGEGANLGFTQPARVEYARRGGRINLDAIDNSAGVDTSDHEVNLKVLLDLAVATGDLAAAERDRLLAAQADDVVAAVLSDSADQGDALTRATDQGADLASLRAVQEDLVRLRVLDPEVEALPGPEEYEARAAAGAGLARPELAVLMAGVKRRAKEAVLADDLPDDPAVRPALVAYFPPALAHRFDGLLDRHRLRRELIASELANDLVDHLGITAPHRLCVAMGVGIAEVAAAHWVARSSIDASRWWALLDEHRSLVVDPTAEDALDGAVVVARLLESLARQELARWADGGRPVSLGAIIEPSRRAFEDVLDAVLSGRVGRADPDVVTRLEAGGLPHAAAVEVAALERVHVLPDVVDVVAEVGRSPAEVLAVFLAVGDLLVIERLASRARAVAPGPGASWPAAARRAVLDDLYHGRRQAARSVLDEAPAGSIEGRPAAEAWLTRHRDVLADAVDVAHRVDQDREAGLDALVVASRAITRALADLA